MTDPQRQPPDVGTIVEDPVHGYTVRFDQIGSDTEAAELEFTAQPQASGPPAHVHPKSYERFEVLSGAVTLRSGRDRSVVETGEKVTVPPGVSHTWHNHTDQPAVVRVEMDPGLTMARFLDEWYGLARDGRLNSKGDLGLLHTAVLFYPHINNGLWQFLAYRYAFSRHSYAPSTGSVDDSASVTSRKRFPTPHTDKH